MAGTMERLSIFERPEIIFLILGILLVGVSGCASTGRSLLDALSPEGGASVEGVVPPTTAEGIEESAPKRAPNLALEERLAPENFIGTSRDVLILRLGGADYRRFDQGVEILQFRLASCVVDFVLSAGGAVASYHVRHRVYGEIYDEVSCSGDLAAREKISE